MFRMKPIADADRAALYFGKSDGGYYLKAGELRREWGGKGAQQMLGLTGTPEFEQFKRLIHGLDPHTGKQLTALLVEDRIPAWDFTCSVPKGVTSSLEGGDGRIREALWEAGRETMADLEQHITTRVRKGGVDADRVTSNMVWFGVEHPETRPTKADGMPDWDRHLHMVGFNLTYDEQERQWKAIKMRPVFDMKKWFDRRFDLRMSAKLADLGYEIETKLKPDGRGGMVYHTWDIKAAPAHEKEWRSVNDKNSRRTKEVEEAEKQIVAEMKARDPNAPDALSAVARDKLGASSRRAKRDDLTLDELRAYWQSRVTPEEKRAIDATIARARLGLNPRPETAADRAMAWSIAHHFERSSVCDFRDLAITAMEKGMGKSRVEEFAPEAWRKHGLLFQGDEVSTNEVLAEEARLIAFAREGRGCWRPMGPAAGDEPDLSHLSADQQAAVRHIWRSPDRVIMIEGDAGSGKTDAMQVTIPGINRQGVFLAPSASASRGTLREKGFQNADTISRFLLDEKLQQQAKDGFIYIDEVPLAGIRQMDQVFDKAKELNARVILQGDRKQHASPQRGGVFDLLPEFAGVPVARLTHIWRQTNKEYKRAVAAIAKGDILGGHDILTKLGWVKQTPASDHNRPLVEDYLAAIWEKRPGGKPAEVLVVAPTHRELDELTVEIRQGLKASGILHGEEHSFAQLKPLQWTEAQKGDRDQYDGNTQVVQFHRNSGPFKAGTRVAAADLLPEFGRVKPQHFAVYAPGEIGFRVGETIRITANGRDKTGKHRVDNGSVYKITGFPDGDIALSNGWVLSKNFGHYSHGYCSTSHASQGRTVDRVLIAMGHESRPAISAAQYYVSASRARESCTIYSDLSPEVLRESIQRADRCKSATELFRERKPEAEAVKAKAMTKATGKANATDRMRAFMEKVRRTYVQLQRKAAAMVGEPRKTRTREVGYAR